MGFSDVLKLYLNKTQSTAKDLSTASGISASALSRYRSGKRIPDQEQIEKLICGLVQLASENNPELDEAIIRNAFSEFTEKPKLDYDAIIKNLNAAIEALDISVSGLSRALSFDPSYLSRIRTGQRKPADLDKFLIETAEYIARTNSPLAIAGLIGQPAEEIVPVGRCTLKLCSWLNSKTISQHDYLGEFLYQLDAFNIKTYMSNNHFPEADYAQESEILSLPKYYYGFDEMKKGELDFFRTVASSGANATVYMCNSIPMEDLTLDAAYMRAWMQSIAMMIMKGADRENIKTIVIESGVTNIGSYAFYLCSGLTSVTIPDSVTNIGNGAFYECSGLTSITLPDSVTNIGDAAFSNCKGLTSVTIPDNVTSISSSMFSYCSGLTSVTIPESVTSIGDGAFNGCSGLTSVTIPASVTSIYDNAFTDCKGLTSVTISNGVTSIGSYAFYGCTGLTSITIPASVTSISNSVFIACISLASIEVDENNEYYCSVDGNLFNKDKTELIQYAAGKKDTSYTIPDSVTKIGDYAFFGCIDLTSITIPNGVTSIGNGAFQGCRSLKSITIPNSVESIGNSAFTECDGLTSVTSLGNIKRIAGSTFQGCSGLKSVTIPEGVEEIDWYAFAGCGSLTSVTIPGIATYIGDNAFENCIKLTSISIPGGVTSIGSYAFQGCTGLESVTISAGLTNLGYNVFQGCRGLTSIDVDENNESFCSVGGNLFNKDKTELIQYAVAKTDTSYTIPNSVTKIGDNAFLGCSSLTSITIPDNVTIIGSSAFFECSGLTSLTIPDSVTKIGYAAFSGCSGLTSLTISNNLTNIYDHAFLGCSGLTSVTIPDSVTNIGFNAFDGCSGLISVELPNGLTNIGPSAFEGCSSLTSVTIPINVADIGSDAFYDCTSLTSIDVDERNKNYSSEDGNLFDKNKTVLLQYALGKTDASYIIPESVVRIRERAFENCVGLTSVKIPGGVTDIGWNVFSGCTGLASIDVDEKNENYSSIDGNLFNKDKTKLIQYAVGKTDEEYTIPDSVKSIGERAFYRCTGLTSITISAGVTDIGWNAISGCTGLTSINVDEDNKMFSSIDGNLFTKNKTELIQYAVGKTDEAYTIPNGVEYIGNTAFEGCSSLTSVKIPNSVEEIGYSAFAKCTGLTSVTIPDGITHIGDCIFADCTGLTSVIIPTSVTIIIHHAFDGCTSLEGDKVVYSGNVTSENYRIFVWTKDMVPITGVFESIK